MPPTSSKECLIEFQIGSMHLRGTGKFAVLTVALTVAGLLIFICLWFGTQLIQLIP